MRYKLEQLKLILYIIAFVVVFLLGMEMSTTLLTEANSLSNLGGLIILIITILSLGIITQKLINYLKNNQNEN